MRTSSGFKTANTSQGGQRGTRWPLSPNRAYRCPGRQLLAAALSAGAHAVTGRLPFPGTGEAHVAVGAEGIWLATQNAVYRIGE